MKQAAATSAPNLVSQPTGFWWRVYRLIFLDLWQRRFFHLPLAPQVVDFTQSQKDQYLKSLNLRLIVIDHHNQPVTTLPPQPTLYYGDHPSSLDALFVYFALFTRQPWVVSFLHNQWHLAFLKTRMIPVGARFAARKFTPLGLKMKLAQRLENLSETECRSLNQAVPETIAQKLLNRESVVIFPSGGWGRWQDGLGFALDLVAQQNPDFQLTLQPVRIIDFGELRSVVHSWLHIFGWRADGVVKVKLGQPKTLSELTKQSFMNSADQKTRAKAIRAWLEADYRQQ